MAERDRMEQRETPEDIHMADLPSYRTPRWVKTVGIVALILVLLVVIIMVTGIGGEHGPGRHMRSAGAGNTPTIEQGVQQP